MARNANLTDAQTDVCSVLYNVLDMTQKRSAHSKSASSVLSSSRCRPIEVILA